MNIGTLTIEMAANIARLQADMNQAKTVVNESMQSIQQAVDLAKKAFIAYAGVATVEAFAGIVRGSIDAAAAMGKLATQAGVTVEAMSGLASVGKLSGTSSDQVAGAMQKMSMAMSGAGEDAKGAGAALRALGVNFDDFSKMSPDQRMLTVAKAMDGFSDGAGKSAAAMLLMGKSGADLLPYMKDLAQVGELQAKVTGEQAAQARDFDLNLKKVQASSDAWKKEISMALLPALDEASKAYLSVMNGMGGVRDEVSKLSKDGSITEWARDALNGVTYLMQGFEYVLRLIKAVGLAAAGLAAGMVQAFQGNMRGAAEAFSAAWADITGVFDKDTLGEKLRDQFNKVQQAKVKNLQDYQAAVQTVIAAYAGYDTKVQQAAMKALKDSYFGADKPELSGNLNQALKSQTEKVSEYDKLIEKIKEKTAASNAELTQDTQLTEGQKMAIQVMEQLRTGKLKLTQAQTQAVSAALSEMLASEQLSNEHANQVKATMAANEAHVKYIQSLVDGVDKLQKQIDAQKQANDELGLSKDAIGELRAAELERQAATLDGMAIRQMDKNLDEAQYNLLKQQAAELRELAQLKREGGAKEAALADAKAASEAWKQVTDQIDKAGTNALMNMFENGTSFAKAFRDTLAAMFKTLILRPVISFIMNPISGAIGQLLGVNTGGAAGGASMLSGLGNLGSFGSAVGAFGGTFATGAMNTIFGTGMGAGLDAAGAMLANGATASGLGMGVGAVAPYALAAVAAYQMLSSLNGGESRSGGQYGVAYNGAVTNNRRGETYNYVGQQYNRDNSLNADGTRTKFTNGETYLMEADGIGGSADTAVRKAISATATNIQSTLKALGSSMTLSQFFAGFETSSEGRGGNMAGGAFSDGTKFGSTGKGSNYDGTLYDKAFTTSPDMKTALANLTTDLKQTTIQALQAANDIPQTIKDMLKDVDAKALDDTGATALITQIQTQIANVQSLQQAFSSLQIKTLGDVTFDAASKIISALGGIDAATAKLSSYYQNYYTDAERVANQTKQLQDAFKALGLDMPNSRDAFRQLMEAQDLSTDKGRAMYASLLKLADAFAALVPATDAAAKANADAAAKAKAAADAAKAASDKLDAAKTAAQSAYDALSRAVNAQITVAQATEQAASQQISAIESVMGVLKSNIASLAGEISASTSAAAGRAFITQALAAVRSTGYLPDATDLGSAISAARSGLTADNFSSAYDQRMAQAQLQAQLQALNDAAGDQLTDAQQQLAAAQKQIAALQAILDNAKAQLDALNGIDSSVKSVEDALKAFTDALSTLLGLTGSTATATKPGVTQTQTGASPQFVVGGGGSPAAPASSGASSLFVVGGSPVKNVPAFADGGFHAGGWALVGERGPEVVNFKTPAQIYTAGKTQQMLQTGTNTSSGPDPAQVATLSLLARFTRVVERWDGNGMPETRATT